MSLFTEKTFVVANSETGERVVLTQLENENFTIKINSDDGEIRPETFEEVGRRIQEMMMG